MAGRRVRDRLRAPQLSASYVCVNRGLGATGRRRGALEARGPSSPAHQALRSGEKGLPRTYPRGQCTLPPRLPPQDGGSERAPSVPCFFLSGYHFPSTESSASLSFLYFFFSAHSLQLPIPPLSPPPAPNLDSHSLHWIPNATHSHLSSLSNLSNYSPVALMLHFSHLHTPHLTVLEIAFG